MSYIQLQSLSMYYDPLPNLVSFEEVRLSECQNMKIGARNDKRVWECIKYDKANEDGGQGLDRHDGGVEVIRKYLQDSEGISVFAASNARVEAELLQLKLVRLSAMAAKYGWNRLLASSLFAYAKGEIVFNRRSPAARHIDLAYSFTHGLPGLREFMAAYASATSHTYNTRVELINLCPKHPDFLRDAMLQSDSLPVAFNPLV
ncbi:hypothetical protein EsH8_I_000460 [Colletotrichum jinshuiense]